ncbi:Rossmann-like and DUF2520 domain-containing protein [Anaerobranca gottschalkii]|uniref:Predicted oxidoreductase, contains short-chain dehydrogenase (SDR) and DUF2520 domains n=1 Tax=Anaerobranca gottschalkii DSM 13577 TaxID=1120990 RepID=A0A1H9ZXI4_9FIRM|nr:Rossmann-like and DUF2520 domain-containing protein [Anaerobranca gottschalkii]SES86482.1 Predicted oxidoreductase, contains short-chain dehydrogenase (SDR) and DUF2520 domains [Anaerobranca gottschalkii DSM 13577]
MKIAFVGAGKVGRVFGWYLKSKGLNVLGYNSRRLESAKQAALETDSRVLSLEEVVASGEIIFITTSDKSIGEVCNQIAKDYRFKRGQTVVHMSGGLGSDILSSAKEQGANIFSLHPMQSFASIEKGKEEIKNTFFTFEGDGEEKIIIQLLEKIGNPYTKINSSSKSLYHTAACISSNYLVTLTNIAKEILKKIGFDDKDALKVLLPLMKGTLENIEKLGIEQALTGPIVRGDYNTVQNHLQNLEGLGDIGKIYILLGKETVKLAQKRNLAGEQIESLNRLFEGWE